MANDNFESFQELNNDLISHLISCLKAVDNEDNEEWQQPSVWKDVVNNLKDIREFYTKKNDFIGYAEVQIGIAKYFDFYYTGWMDVGQCDKLKSLVSKIMSSAVVIKSSHSVRPISSCGAHEDGACVTGSLGKRFETKTDLTNNGWPNLPWEDAESFKIEPKNKALTKGTELFRIVGKKNSPYGSWWIEGKNLPQIKKYWRSKFAVLTSWNHDDYYVTFEVKDEALNVWKGDAASQKIPKKNCILKGGAEQIWIDKDDLPKGLKHQDIHKIRKNFG